MAWAVALGALLQACASPKPSPNEQSAPRLAFEEALYDFGAVEQGTRVAHVYRFRNTGGFGLRIDNVRAPCDCTAAVAAAGPLSSGGEGAIEVVCDTARFLGDQNGTVGVYSNDPAQPVTTLALIGRVRAEVAVDPPQLYVGHLRRGQTAPNGVRIVGNAPAVSAEAAGSVIEPLLDAAGPNERDRRLQVAVKRDAPLGKFEGPVTLHTGKERHPSLTLLVAGVVDGDLVISPGQLNFGATVPGATTSRVVALHNYGTQPVHITGVRLTPEVGTAAVTTVRDGEDYRVTVTLSAGLPSGKVSGTLDVDTDHPEQPRMRVPFAGRVTEKS